MAISVGDKVQWRWGQGTGSGQVVQIYKENVTKTLKGSDVTRKASDDDPAYLIKQQDGDQVLKGASELETI